ncbi:PP2C family protein-serine/threonine phosphatase [Limobrevibacterium gyesilva]|uniref:Protein phosphatase 2C domain-containing protein n=1 Tax=Limobrevibacterium gyesilva TaxID=2991712 RepID=A0AA42CGD9_9PROT|nr:protein phosphatase 2C domain-containing protein [Limobrevibacterium gyesilva]MCW3473912.1 protein phosphatase 2C domain-containing protein [Limobrevibacterium gyesilva]
MTMDRFRSWATTHVGTVRTHNEDAYVNRPDLGLWAVADGAGGHARGEVASRMIVDALEGIPVGLSAGEILAEVRNRMQATHAALRDAAASGDARDISASTVVILIARDDHFACLWAGDSRGYLLRNGQMMQITKDHSLVQELVDAGAISAADAENHPRANVITRAVGAESDIAELDKVTSRLTPGDRFLLCSDGLCKTLDEAEIAHLLATPAEAEPSERLVDAALAHNVRDNVTAVAIEVLAAA